MTLQQIFSGRVGNASAPVPQAVRAALSPRIRVLANRSAILNWKMSALTDTESAFDETRINFIGLRKLANRILADTQLNDHS